MARNEEDEKKEGEKKREGRKEEAAAAALLLLLPPRGFRVTQLTTDSGEFRLFGALKSAQNRRVSSFSIWSFLLSVACPCLRPDGREEKEEGRMGTQAAHT